MILRSIYGMKPEKRGHAQGHPEDQNWSNGANPGHLLQSYIYTTMDHYSLSMLEFGD